MTVLSQSRSYTGPSGGGTSGGSYSGGKRYFQTNKMMQMGGGAHICTHCFLEYPTASHLYLNICPCANLQLCQHCYELELVMQCPFCQSEVGCSGKQNSY
jgi:hypothetical protein